MTITDEKKEEGEGILWNKTRNRLHQRLDKDYTMIIRVMFERAQKWV